MGRQAHGAATSFVGRQQDKQQLLQLLARCTLITLVGPAGVGKSRLAGEVAAHATARVLRLAASAVGTLASAMARSLDWRSSDGSPSWTRLVRALADGDVRLIVLDGAERAASDVRELIEALAAAEVTVLCTSRQPLGIAGEAVLRLEGLPPAEARALYLNRVAGLTPAALLQAIERDPQLGRLLDALDGLPLAIELAAARAPTRTPSELLAEMDHRFRALAPREWVGLPSLWAALDESWLGLDPSQRHALARLALIEPALSLGLACAVLADDRSAPILVDELVHRSLLVSEPGPGHRIQFRLLASVRDFARAKGATVGIDALERAAIRQRQVRWVVNTVQPLVDAVAHAPGPALETLAALRDQLTAALAAVDRHSDDALRLVLALDTLLIRSGPADEHERLLREQLAKVPRDSRAAVSLLTSLARVHQLAHRYQHSRELLERALGVVTTRGWHAEEVKLRYFLARARAQSMDDPAQCKQAAEQARDAARTHQLAAYQAGALSTLGMIAAYQGDPHAAIALHEQAERLLPADERSRIRPVIRLHHALAQLAAGNLAMAEALAQDACTIVRHSRDELLLAKLQPLMARLALERDQLDQAQALLDASRQAADRLDDVSLHVDERMTRARLHSRLNQPHAAQAALLEARTLALPILTPRLRRALDDGELAIQPRASQLRIAHDGAGFRRDQAAPVDLRRRAAPRRILAALLASEQALDVEQLSRAGWPAQQMHPESAAKRVWTAVWTLRKAGLGGLLVNRSDGYQLEASAIERVPFEEL